MEEDAEVAAAGVELVAVGLDAAVAVLLGLDTAHLTFGHLFAELACLQLLAHLFSHYGFGQAQVNELAWCLYLQVLPFTLVSFGD